MTIKNHLLDFKLLQYNPSSARGQHFRATPGDWALPELRAVLGELNPLPRHTAFLGICEDGLPLLMDLTNPSPGSVLILSEGTHANRSLLGSLLSSIRLVNSPEDVQMDLITPQPGSFPEIRGDDPRRLSLYSVTTDLYRAVWEVGQSLDDRRSGRPAVPARVLLIDGLEKMLAQLDRDSFDRLIWTIVNGPLYRVWVFATLDLDQATIVDDSLVHSFGTRLFGPIRSPLFHLYLAGIPADVTAALVSGREYCVEMSGKAVKFWIPHPG